MHELDDLEEEISEIQKKVSEYISFWVEKDILL